MNTKNNKDYDMISSIMNEFAIPKNNIQKSFKAINVDNDKKKILKENIKETAFDVKVMSELDKQNKLRRAETFYPTRKDFQKQDLRETLKDIGLFSKKDNEFLTLRKISKVSQQEYDNMKNSFINIDYLKNLFNYITTINCNFKSVACNDSVGGISPLTYLIESKYEAKKERAQEMKNKYDILQNFIINYRTINGDGNCFYRAVMFRYLEILILTKNIEQLQNVVFDFINSFKSEKLQSRIIIRNMNIKPDLSLKILILIVDLLKNNMVEDAHKILVKSFSTCQKFDYAIILYFRYILYDYIRQNENKTYLRSFPVKIGNLLPYQFETEEGNFLFDDFYEKYLLNFFTDAEKIIIYLTPFVLQIEVDVIIFDDNEKEILKSYKWEGNSELKTNEVISLLNHKNHYEIIYTPNDYQKYKNIFEIYENQHNPIILSEIEKYLNPDKKNFNALATSIQVLNNEAIFENEVKCGTQIIKKRKVNKTNETNNNGKKTQTNINNNKYNQNHNKINNQGINAISRNTNNNNKKKPNANNKDLNKINENNTNNQNDNNNSNYKNFKYNQNNNNQPKSNVVNNNQYNKILEKNYQYNGRNNINKNITNQNNNNNQYRSNYNKYNQLNLTDINNQNNSQNNYNSRNNYIKNDEVNSKNRNNNKQNNINENNSKINNYSKQANKSNILYQKDDNSKRNLVLTKNNNNDKGVNQLSTRLNQNQTIIKNQNQNLKNDYFEYQSNQSFNSTKTTLTQISNSENKKRNEIKKPKEMQKDIKSLSNNNTNLKDNNNSSHVDTNQKESKAQVKDLNQSSNTIEDSNLNSKSKVFKDGEVSKYNETLKIEKNHRCMICKNLIENNMDVDICKKCLKEQIYDFTYLNYLADISSGRVVKQIFEEQLELKLKKNEKGKKYLFPAAIKKYNEIFRDENLNQEQIINETKKKLCVNCADQIKEDFLELPCKCVLCCEEDLNEYLNSRDLTKIECLCKKKYDQEMLFQLGNLIIDKNIDYKDKIKEYFENQLKGNCCICRKKYDLALEDINYLTDSDNNYNEFLSKLNHNFCNECYLLYNDKEFKCSICEVKHILSN